MKNNHRIATVLRKIYDRAVNKVFFSIFPGCGATNNSSYMATIQDFANILEQGTYAIQPDLSYDAYMERQEAGRFTLHSYPFGGGTTAIDALILEKPLVVLRGRHEYNRFPATILKRIGLEELIADDMDQWVNICVKLIDDGAYLEDVTRRLKEVDLDEKVFRLADASGLRRAFDHLIKYDSLIRKDDSRKPIAID